MIATTRRLTNPCGKDWQVSQERETLFQGKQHKEISKDIPQVSKGGTTISLSIQITPGTQLTQADKCKTYTSREENERRKQGNDPQYTGQTPVNKRLVNQESHKQVFEQTPQLYHEVASRDNGIITGNQLPLNNTQVNSSCANGNFCSIPVHPLVTAVFISPKCFPGKGKTLVPLPYNQTEPQFSL